MSGVSAQLTFSYCVFRNGQKLEMRDTAEIVKVVKAALAKDFNKVRILEVRVSEVDSDEDEKLLRIDVIFEGRPKDIDIKKLSGVVRHVRPRLTDIGEESFPLFSFISKGDAGAGLEPA